MVWKQLGNSIECTINESGSYDVPFGSSYEFENDVFTASGIPETILFNATGDYSMEVNESSGSGTENIKIHYTDESGTQHTIDEVESNGATDSSSGAFDVKRVQRLWVKVNIDRENSTGSYNMTGSLKLVDTI